MIDGSETPATSAHGGVHCSSQRFQVNNYCYKKVPSYILQES